MRCKNCGSENDEKLYICQNCGSPLYDEDEPADDNSSETRVFGTLDDPENTKTPAEAAAERAAAREQEEEERKRKKQVTTIIVLAVVLLAIIIGTVIAVVHAKNKDAEDTTGTSVSTSVSETSTAASTTQKQQESTTKESTTATTTTTTTEKQTTAGSFTVKVDYNYGGTVSGNGNFKLGESATVRATADTGYSFDGWYDGNTKVSSDAVYTFTVTDNRTLKAIFTISEALPDEGPGIDTESDEEVFN